MKLYDIAIGGTYVSKSKVAFPRRVQRIVAAYPVDPPNDIICYDVLSFEGKKINFGELSRTSFARWGHRRVTQFMTTEKA